MRRRRADTDARKLTALVTASSTPRLIRNDLMPKLALTECAPADLVISARNVRKVKPAHLREVAAAISSLAFAIRFSSMSETECVEDAFKARPASLATEQATELFRS